MMDDATLREAIEKLLPSVDLQTTGLKKFMKILSKELGGEDLKPRKAFIKEALTEAMNREDKQEEEDDDEEEAAEEEAEEDDDEEDGGKKPAKKGNSGLKAAKEISNKLAKFLGKPKGTSMARTDIVKSLWAYIRENDLQNPDNRREIVLDDAMKKVFGCERFTMFTMNKYIGAHIDPFKPVDLSSPSPASRKRKAAKSPAKKSGEKKKRKAGSQPPYRLSAELEEIVGKSVLPRPQVVAAVWVYIKANNLQNPNDGREILCDDKLQAVMKKPKVTMFTMNQLITPHLIEKVDKAEYQHGDSDAAESGDERSI